MVTTIEKLGTWDEIFADAPDVLKDIGSDLRSVVVGLHPDTVEVPRRGDGAVAFGFGEKKMSQSYCYVSPKKKWVNLGFFWGTSLEDQNGLLEGTGKKLRHVKVRDTKLARSAKIAQLVYEAMEERRNGLA